MIMDPDKAHKEYYDKNPNGCHPNMSPETRNVLSELKIDFIGMSKDMDYIKEAVHDIRERVSSLHDEKSEEHKEVNERIRMLEHWQVRIGAKIAIWASLGTFLGGVASALIVWYLTQ